jgi:hypothetical protein
MGNMPMPLSDPPGEGAIWTSTPGLGAAGALLAPVAHDRDRALTAGHGWGDPGLPAVGQRYQPTEIEPAGSRASTPCAPIRDSSGERDDRR